MRFLLKMIFRNITVKPLRTMIMVLCIAAVSLTFSLCLTINVSSKAAVEEQIRSGNGRTDIILSNDKGFKKLPVLPDGCDSMTVVFASSYFQIQDISNYKYIQKKNIKVLGLDTAKAIEFGLLSECTDPQEDEAVISYAMTMRYGYEIGDELILPSDYNTDVTLKVSEIVLQKGLLSVMPQTIIVTEETAKAFSSVQDIEANMVYIDAPEGRTYEIASQLSVMYPDSIVQQVTGTAETDDMIKSLTRTFFILFVVTLLMILFIISAFAKNIAAERLSVIGTLRSIGAEEKTAAATLLAECAVYGFLGGAVGTLCFHVLKDVLIGNMLPSVNGIGGSVSVPFYVPLTGLLLSAFISCSVSLITVIRTSETPIRDIIFNGRDSVYHPSVIAAPAGVVLVIFSMILYCYELGFGAYIAGLAAFVSVLCLIIPKLLSALSMLISKHTDGGNFPVLRLSLIQFGTKNSAVMGTVICTAVMLLTVSLYVLSCSVDKLYSVRNYDCDIIISDLSERADRYSTITADRKEFIYSTEETTYINGKNTTVSIFGYDGFHMFSGIHKLPERLADNEIALDRLLMKRLGINTGDNVTLTLKSNTLCPVTITLTAVSGIDSIYYDQRCNAAVISLETYKSIYHDYPSMMEYIRLNAR